jgi:glutamate formiminotransferase
MEDAKTGRAMTLKRMMTKTIVEKMTLPVFIRASLGLKQKAQRNPKIEITPGG